MEEKGAKTDNSNTELNELIKKNEDLLNFQKQCEEEIKSIQKENDAKKEEVKSKNNVELFDLIISELKDYIKSQDQTQQIIQDKQKIQNEINNAYYKAQQASQNIEEVEKFNADIIKKIKEINEEKSKIKIKINQ